MGKLSEYNAEELTAAETLSVLKTGFAGRCPRCGEGKLLNGLLAVRPACSHCGLNFSNSEKGDGPAFFAISIVGTLAAIGAVLTEVFFQPPYWVHAALWIPVSIIGSLYVLRWSKGIIIAMQYKHQQEAFLDE